MSDSGLIDWEQLEMVFGDEDDFDEDMAELFQEFMEDAVEHFTQIAAEDFDTSKSTIAKLSHKVKGSAANFGFSKMAGSLGTIENDIDSLSKDRFEELFALARGDYQSSVEEVASRYPALAV